MSTIYSNCNLSSVCALQLQTELERARLYTAIGGSCRLVDIAVSVHIPPFSFVITSTYCLDGVSSYYISLWSFTLVSGQGSFLPVLMESAPDECNHRGSLGGILFCIELLELKPRHTTDTNLICLAFRGLITLLLITLSSLIFQEYAMY